MIPHAVACTSYKSVFISDIYYNVANIIKTLYSYAKNLVIGGCCPPFLFMLLTKIVMQTIEQQVVEAVRDTVENLGFDLVKVTFKGSVHKILEILIDRIDGKQIAVGDCRSVSRHVSAILDVEDIIADKYYLEVSSAGIERPLTQFKDYIRFAGKEVNIKLSESLNGQTRYQGKIVQAIDNKIHLGIKEETVIIPFEIIKKSSLVLTDEMFRSLLNKS